MTVTIEHIRRTWEELRQVKIIDVVREAMDSSELEELTFRGQDAWNMAGGFHPDYLYVSSYHIETPSSPSEEAVAKVLVIRPELERIGSTELVRRLIELYRTLEDKYGAFPNIQTQWSLGAIQDQIKYMCLRLGDGFFREDVQKGFIVGPTKPTGHTYGHIVFSYDDAKLLDDPHTPEDFFERSEALTHEDSSDALDAMIRAIEKIMDGKFELINVWDRSLVMRGMQVNFFKSRCRGNGHYLPAIMVGYGNDNSMDYGRDKTTDEYDVTVVRG